MDNQQVDLSSKGEIDDILVLFFGGAFVFGVISRFFWTRFQNEILYIFVAIISIGLVVNLFSTYHLFRLNCHIPSKIKLWLFGSLFILIVCLILLYVTYFRSAAVVSLDQDFFTSIFDSLSLSIGFIFLISSILANVISQTWFFFTFRGNNENEINEELLWEFGEKSSFILTIQLILIVIAILGIFTTSNSVQLIK